VKLIKRFGLLIVTNLAILFVLNIVLTVLQRLGVFGGAEVWGAYGPLLVMAAVFGFGGAFISLAISKWMAKWTTGAKVIEQPGNEEEAWLLETVRRQAEQAGIKTPEVAVYDADELNAFATGPTRNNALVAVSSGLLRRMRRNEVEAVLGHEVSHVANGDMVTLTLIQGVLNTFVIFFSRIIGGIVDSALRGKDEESRGPGIGYWVATIFAEIVLGILASFIVAWFSRRREYRADRGGANLSGTGNMIAALRRLGSNEESQLPQSVAAFGINGARAGGLAALLRSHPPIAERIEALQQSQGAAQQYA